MYPESFPITPKRSIVTKKEMQTKHPHNWEEVVKELSHIAAQKGITQLEIAKRTGLLQTNISRIFLLKYNPTLKTVTLIAAAIGAEIKIEEAKQ